MKKIGFDDFVLQVGDCVKHAREMMGNLSVEELQSIDSKIHRAFEVIEEHFREELQNFLEDHGVAQKLKKISLHVIKAIKEIDGYSIEAEEGMLYIYRRSLAETQPLTPLASAASLYFSLKSADPHFDFLLACLSQKEFFDTIQLHHYFRNHPSQVAYKKAS